MGRQITFHIACDKTVQGLKVLSIEANKTDDCQYHLYTSSIMGCGECRLMHARAAPTTPSRVLILCCYNMRLPPRYTRLHPRLLCRLWPRRLRRRVPVVRRWRDLHA